MLAIPSNPPPGQTRRTTARSLTARLVPCIVGLFFMTTGCAETRFGGMTVHDAFPDERVAALVEAVSRGKFSEADKQLKAGADINTVGTNGISPLLWVMGVTKSMKRTEYLLKAGANPNYKDAKSGETAIHLTAGGDMPEMLELLLNYKGNPSLAGPNGDVPLRTAVFQQRDKNIRILMKYGAAMHPADPRSESVASTAARLGRFDLVAYFLEQGLNHNLDDLAIDVYIRQVSAQEPWKGKVIEMLKARGVKYPPNWPRK